METGEKIHEKKKKLNTRERKNLIMQKKERENANETKTIKKEGRKA